jgi:uncharacterized membrane protein (UPF0182 family)
LSKILPLPLAIPAAFASHFLLDMLPHFGLPHDERDHSRLWKWFGIFDFCFSWVFLGYLSLAARHHYAVFACGVIAASPDFVWVARIIRTRSFDLRSHRNRFERWHAGIQKYERRWGIYVELPIAFLMGYLVIKYW